MGSKVASKVGRKAGESVRAAISTGQSTGLAGHKAAQVVCLQKLYVPEQSKYIVELVPLTLVSDNY